MADLCDRCQRIFQRAKFVFSHPDLVEYNRAFGSYQALQQSAEESLCQLCRLLFSLRRQDALDRLIQDGHQDEFNFVFDFSKEDEDLLEMNILHATQLHATIFKSAVIFKRSESDIGGGSIAGVPTWSIRSVQLIRDWLSKCSTGHTSCSPLGMAKRLPLRFLDIGLADKIPDLRSQLNSSDNIDSLSLKHMPQVKLVSTQKAGLALNTQYLTLSHCWGRSPVAKLSNQNLKQYHQCIPRHVLEPPTAATFRHAIYVAHCLGFRYLWIDALCINQEDGEEKEYEISYMNEIYAYATLNLSATAAHDGSGGLFFERDPREADAIRHLDLVAFLPPSHPFVDEVLWSPINKRAWVFQERMLATRVLHFCHTRLFWECCALQEAEPLSDASPRSMVVPSRQTKQLVLPHERQGCLASEKARLRWAAIVESYSKTSLTFPGDTLLALSAIATTLSEQRGLDPPDYAAGLWVPDLPLALRWRVSHKPDRVPVEYVAPSWSWAALFCTVDIERDVYVRVFADEFAPSIRLKTASAPFGSVKSAVLRLRGMLRSLRYLESEDCFQIGRSDRQAATVISSGFPGTISDGLPDKVYKWSKRGHTSAFVQQSTQSHQPPLDESDIFICEWDHGIPGHDQTPRSIRFALHGGSFLEIQDGSFHLLPLGQRRRFSKEDEEAEEENEADDRDGSFDRIEGLILHRTSAKGEYVRVGIFYYTLGDAARDQEKVLNSIFGEDECLGDDSYLRRDDHSDEVTYTVQIV